MRPPRSLALLAVLAGLWLATPAIAQAPAGRIAEASGPVSLRGPGGGWSAVPRGAALVEGHTLRTGPRSQAELDLGVNRIGLDPDTVLRIDSAHPATPAITLEQGRAMLLLRSLQPGQVARVEIPRGSVSLVQPGLYVIEVGPGGRPATVGVTRGMAQVYGPDVSMMVAAGQTGVIGGADGQPARLRAGVAEGFLADDATAPPPQVVRPTLAFPPLASPRLAPPPAYAGVAPPDELVELPGGEALLRDGSWAEAPEYGSVWYPPVAPGWSPYADSWADRAAWGYTPWYYGTWVMIGPRWGWLPPPRHHYPHYARGYAPPPQPYGRGRPPPAIAQPNRPPPVFGGPPPVHGGGRPPLPYGTLPGVPPPAYGGGRPPPPYGTPPGAPPAYSGGRPPPPYAAPPGASPPVFGGGRPSPPYAAPPGASPPVFGGGRPPPPYALPPGAAPPPFLGGARPASPPLPITPPGAAFPGPGRAPPPTVMVPPPAAAPRPMTAPPMAAPAAAAPHIFAPRPAAAPFSAGPPPAAFVPRPMAQPPMAVPPPRAASPAPARRCGPPGTPC